jgi:membrane-bound lytic murein transglycosylase A
MSAERLLRAAVLATAALVFVASVILVRWLSQPLPSGPLALTRTSFSELPGWSGSDPRPALAAFKRSCAQLLLSPPATAMTGNGYAGHAGDWVDVCSHIPPTDNPAQVRHWFEANFVPFAIGQGPSRKGLFTGYYEPELHGSRAAHGAFKTPVYGEPDDLVSVDLGQFREKLKGERVAGRVVGHALVPYATRAEIDRDGLRNAKILFYADDPARVFFLHIQGSGRVVFDDGSVRRVAYAAQNGRTYTPIGRALVEEGEIERDKVSMQAIRAWMDAHPTEARAVMEKDQSFVFFKELPVGDPALGSSGAEGVPLTPNASLAVDDRTHPLGVPFYVVAQTPDPDAGKPERTLDRLYIAQDIGGAIRGPIRADLFFGYGHDAESMAGRMKSEGSLYVLLPVALANHIAEANS